ncbi:hypothetical protein F750_3081 [Streptomyces sp. PAMC 26508]|nr:hypothetical protein F750_3081 [Streptomyces sp. PAMC 26508]
MGDEGRPRRRGEDEAERDRRTAGLRRGSQPTVSHPADAAPSRGCDQPGSNA